MDEELKNKIILAVREKKTPLNELAVKLFISERQLSTLLKEWGVELTKKRKYNTVAIPEREELMKIYQEKKTTAEVAKHFGVNINKAIGWMKQLGIPTRKMKMTEEQKVKFLENHLDNLKNLDL